MNILVLNAGSSTLKFRLLKTDGREQAPIAHGLVEKWDEPAASMKFQAPDQAERSFPLEARSPGKAAGHAIQHCMPFGIDALAHRVVHGGPHYKQTTRIDADVVRGIRDVSRLAPLHNVNALAGIEAGLQLLPKVPSVAAFDTAFHQTMPDAAALYAIPWQLARDHHLRRYGFHGISHQYLSHRWHELTGRQPAGTRLITCHLGSGASVCAIRDGKSIDTSMGFTPMEGLVMGTRSGDIDPGLVLHLLNELKMSGPQIEQLLNRQSGLLGLSGSSADVRELEQAATNGDARAELALEMFAYRVRKYIGAYAVVLQGIDAIVFSGGIGEHSSAIRKRIAAGLECLGVKFDEASNASVPSGQPTFFHADSSRVQLWMIPTDEEGQIARETFQLLGSPMTGWRRAIRP